MRRSGEAQDRGDSDEPERPDHRDLDRPVGARARIERGDPAFDEMDVLDAMEVVLQDGPPRERDASQMRRKAAKARRIQAGKNPVLHDHDWSAPGQAGIEA